MHRFGIFCGSMIGMIGFVAALIALAGTATAASIAGASTVGDIALVDQSGATFHLRDLAGYPVAITFVATRCQDACPIVNAMFSRLSRSGIRAGLVTVSLDPAYDTPFVMARYARSLDARAPAWRFATGRPRDIARVLAAFGVVVERGTDGVPNAHSDFIYLFDRRGRLTNALPLSTNAVADLRSALVKAILKKD